jgi:hypothetical protein
MLQPLIERRFWGPSRATGFFVVKYTPETQAAVPKHIDMGHVWGRDATGHPEWNPQVLSSGEALALTIFA